MNEHTESNDDALVKASALSEKSEEALTKQQEPPQKLVGRNFTLEPLTVVS